jgi:hypothetical protein
MLNRKIWPVLRIFYEHNNTMRVICKIPPPSPLLPSISIIGAGVDSASDALDMVVVRAEVAVVATMWECS